MKWKGREKEYQREYREEHKKELNEKSKIYLKNNSWCLKKKIMNERLRTKKISYVEYLIEIDKIEKERKSNTIDDPLKPKKEIDNISYEKIKNTNNKKNIKKIKQISYEKMQELEERNERLFFNFYVLVSRFKIKNTKIHELKNKIKILEIENKNHKNKLDSINKEDNTKIHELKEKIKNIKSNNNTELMNLKEELNNLKKKIEIIKIEQQKAPYNKTKPDINDMINNTKYIPLRNKNKRGSKLKQKMDEVYEKSLLK